VQASNQQLDTLVWDMFPALRGVRSANEFLFDPATLEGQGTIRDYYLEYLRWLDIAPAVLPPERLYIHANRPCPANLEMRRSTAHVGPLGTFSLFIDRGLYRSTDALRMALAHELTHLYLLLNGQQVLPDHVTTTGTTGSLPLREEIRTDVAAILLGFGKLMLNGAFGYAKLYERAGYVAQLGYLSVSSFVHLYCTVNTLVGVPPNVAMDGLNIAARTVVSSAFSTRKIGAESARKRNQA
jgi:hypothetical protein